MYPDQTYNPEARRKSIVVLVISVGVLLVLIMVFNWISSHGFIEVTTTGVPGETTYTLINPLKKDTVTSKSSNTSFKKLVRKGNYQLLVKQGNKSYMAIVTGRGFLGTQTLETNLQAERGRTFVGNNPADCMYLSGAILASYQCGGPINNAQVHMPATAKQPTYALKNTNKNYDLLVGIAQTGGGDILLTKPAHIDTDDGSPYAAFSIQDGFILKKPVALYDLAIDKSYNIKPLGQGFVVYDAAFSSLYYYNDISAKPSKLRVYSSSGNLKPYSLVTKGNRLATVFSNDGAVGEIVIQTLDNKPVKRFNLTKQYSSILLCGDNLLCTLSNSRLEIHDTSGNSLNTVATFDGVSAINNSKDGFEIVQEKQVLRLNLSTMTGLVDYSFVDYSYCGIQSTANGYVLCVQGNKLGKVALSIDTRQTSDEIDKKVAPLFNLNEVKNVSVYGNLIFVSPNAGQAKFQPTLNSYGYDPTTLNNASNKIAETVKTAGIDTSAYRVINTLRP